MAPSNKRKQPARTKKAEAVRAPRAGRSAQGNWWLPLSMLLLGSGGAYVVLSSCGKGGEPPQPTSATSAVAPGATNAPIGSGEGQGLIDPSDGGSNNLVAIPADAFVDDRDTGGLPDDVPMLGAAHFQTHVFAKPDYSSDRIGYLRAGAKVAIKDAKFGEPVPRIKTSSCKEGWIAIQPRGYVCLDKGGGALNLEQPNVKLATAPPNFDELLPYKYGHVWRNGTPLYRKVPTPKQWKEYEPWLNPKPKPKKAPELDDPYATPEGSDHEGGGEDALLDAGPPPSLDVADSGAEPDAPWWERDAGKEGITLADTMGDPEGLVARRMAKGFTIAIDRTFSWDKRTWHRTTMGLVAPADSVTIIKAPEFKGVELNDDWQLPIAWALPKSISLYERSGTKTFTGKDRVERQQPIKMLSPTAPGYEEVTTGGVLYWPTKDGKWVRARDVARIDASAPPADLKANEKWIDISIKAQALVAYEGTKPVFATLVSTGKDGTNLKGQFATVQGTFRIREKHVAATMDGDTSGELYSIDDVPYIQYFHTSFALHGAFWHSDFGRVRSHGCVNLSPSDAKRLFFWTEPKLPTGWHAVWSSDEDPGTLVVTRP